MIKHLIRIHRGLIIIEVKIPHFGFPLIFLFVHTTPYPDFVFYFSKVVRDSLDIHMLHMHDFVVVL